jgi:hemolysin D
MEPTDKPHLMLRLVLRLKHWMRRGLEHVAASYPTGPDGIDFLPDADEIERRPLPQILRLTLHILAVGFVLFLLIASFMQVDLVVTGRGKLITPLPNIVIQAFDTAVIQEISVKPGQVVKKGDKLATLDPTFTEADESQLRSRLASLDNQRTRLELELAGKSPKKLNPSVTGSSDDQNIQNRLAYEKQASFVAQLQRLDENIARLRASFEANKKDQASLASRISVLKEMALLQEQLVAQQYAPRSRLLDAQDRLLEAERSAEMSASRSIEIKKELAALEAERQSFKSGWQQKISEEMLALVRERDSVVEQLQKADKRSRLVTLTAPADAIVLEIAKLSVGSIARATEAFITLVPLSQNLEVEVQIESSDIGYVKLGDTVHLKVDTFPYQLHGFLDGTLSIISQDAFTHDARTSGSAGAYYQGRVQLTQTKLQRLPDSAQLLPGMTVTAEIAVGKRTVMTYLLWPLIKALNESIREP